MVNLIRQGISLEDVKGLSDGEFRYKQFEEFFPYIELYNNVINAKELGVVFSPNDFTQKEVRILSTINREMENLGTNDDGRRQSQTNIRHASGQKRSPKRT